MIKFGQVTAYDDVQGVATIQYARPDACAKCGACGGKAHEGSIDLRAVCKTGDWVKVELPDGRFLHATALAYLVPLAFLLAGLLLGYRLSGQNELIALACSLLALGLSLLLLKLADRRFVRSAAWSPRVTAVYATKPEIDDIGCDGHS